MVVALTCASHAARAAETFTYDPVGRLAAITYENGATLAYTYDDNGNVLSIVTSLEPTGVEAETAPLVFALGAATPNPGSGPRNIPFSIPKPGKAALRVFDVTGRLVATLLDRELPAGRYTARFGVTRLAGGVYFYQLRHAGRSLSGRLVVLP